MANYKIKDLQQAQTLNGAVALEIQDGDSTSTFATLDQIAEFLGNTTPVVLLTKAGPIDDSYLPDMSASEIAAAYDRIVADPIHTVPVVRIPDNGGQYRQDMECMPIRRPSSDIMHRRHTCSRPVLR